VAGNFHISSHGKSYSTSLNLEHIIHEMSFGDANTILEKKMLVLRLQLLILLMEHTRNQIKRII